MRKKSNTDHVKDNLTHWTSKCGWLSEEVSSAHLPQTSDTNSATKSQKSNENPKWEGLSPKDQI